MSIKDELKAITNRYVDDFNVICERSREERLKTLQPGARVPAQGKLYGDDARNEFKRKADAHRVQAMSIIGNELRALNEKMTAAPSTDAVNTIQLLKMRSNITPEDINVLMMRYGDNSQVRDTLVDIAGQHDIKDYKFESNPIRVKAEKLKDLNNSINNSLRLESAERGHASAGFVSFLNAAIDDAFPDE